MMNYDQTRETEIARIASELIARSGIIAVS